MIPTPFDFLLLTALGLLFFRTYLIERWTSQCINDVVNAINELKKHEEITKDH